MTEWNMAKWSPGASRVHGLLRGGVPGSISVSGVGQPNLPPLILKTFTGKTPTKISKTGTDTCGTVAWLLPLSADFCSFGLAEQ